MSNPLIYTTPSGTLRSNFASSGLGSKFTVGSTPLLVTALGRWMVAGNSQTHTISLVRVSDSVTVASVNLNLSGQTAGQYVYANLSSQVVLAPSTSYYLVSSETSGGDQWYDDEAITGTADVTFNEAVYNDGTSWTLAGSGVGHAYVPPNMLYTYLDLLAETKASGVEVAFLPVAGASQHTVQKSSTVNGTYSTVGTVPSGSLPVLLDTAPGNYYRYYATVSGSDQSPSSGVAPIALNDSGLTTKTVISRGQSQRHNVFNRSGSYVLARAENLNFSQLSSGWLFPGPYSPFVLADETFSSGLGSLTNFLAGSGTAAASGGHLTYSASAGTTAAWREASATFKAPTAVIGVSVSADTNCIVGVGLMADTSNGVSLEYNPSTSDVQIIGRTGGSGTVLATITGFAPSSSFKLALEIMHNIVNVWADSGSGWSIIGGYNASNGSTYDMRNATYLSSWYPTLYCYSASGGAFSVDVTEFKATYYQGPGGVREFAPVTNLDGSLYRSGETCYIALDRSTVPNGGNYYASTGFHIHPYNPRTNTFGAAIACISGTFSGTPAAAADAKLVYDHTSDGFHVFSPDWCAFGSATPGLWYAFVPRTQLTGVVHVSFSAITLPSGITSGLYGPDVIYLNSNWYLVGTLYTPTPTQTWQTCVIRGSSPNSYSTHVATDTSMNSEGTSFVLIGSKTYIFAGTMSGSIWGAVQIFDFSDLSTLTPIGTLNAPNADTTNQQPQQPSVVWYDDGAGNTVYVLLTYVDTNINSQYQASGPITVSTSAEKLVGWQAPLRTNGANRPFDNLRIVD